VISLTADYMYVCMMCISLQLMDKPVVYLK